MGKKKKQKQARPVVTDVSAVKTSDNAYVASRSYAETVDLLSEGEMDGLVSGDYQYMGNAGETGYSQVVVDIYLATGVDNSSIALSQPLVADSQRLKLGFLRSIYWNDVPVVDKDGYYNFQSVNVHQVVGGPIGTLPTLSTTMNNYTGLTSDEVLDLSVQRSIGERLFGPEIASGEGEFPTDERQAALKLGTKIDKYSKTYTILNKECNKIQVNIKINALFENLQAGPKTYKKAAQLAAEGEASAGYGDTKARTIEYSIYYQPVFDKRFQAISTGTTVPNALGEGGIKIEKSVLSPQQWILAKTERVTGKIDQGYMRTTTIDLSKEDLADTAFFEGWRIRIVRITPESLTSFLRNVSFVDSIVEIYGTQLRYPYSSMVYSQFDARAFSRIPARAYDTRLLKIKVPNNYDPETKTYGRSEGNTDYFLDNYPTYNTLSRKTTGANPWEFSNDGGSSDHAFSNKIVCATVPDNNWNGNFKTETFIGDSEKKSSTEEIFVKEWCDNPAWCFYDILTNPRYGLGEYINEDDIDKWALYEIAQYCDVLVPDGYGGIEPRFTFNYIITSREEAFKVVNDLASAFRGIAYYSNGSIMAVQDKFKNPLSQFTTSNVIDGDFNYASSAKKARHTVAIVRYNDKRNFFQPAVEYVEDEESVRRYGIREIETSALGCTSKGQARRFAKWILASEANETETVSFGVGMEGAYLRPGDIVQIYDNFRNPLKYSGRTNRVEPYVPNTNDAANLAWQGDAEVTPVFGPNFDNIIIDQALAFSGNKLYKLDLLTPTYDYPTGTKDLDSTDNVSRNQLQTVLFSGAHTKTYTGSLAGGDTFRSDYLVSGSGVCTQIFFNTGIAFGGTDNKFDFSNYVITGYTNEDIQGTYKEDPISESYSGGCFSGQNLIWSCEPFFSNDEDFVSGNSSDYRLINIAENDNNSYSISALAYSTGKYDDVESAIQFEGKNATNTPMFPTGNIDGRQATLNTVSQLAFPYPAEHNSVNSTAMTLTQDRAYPTGANGIPYTTRSKVPKLDVYTTLKVTFKPAGFESAQLEFEGNTASINTNIKAETSLNYAICISRGTNFDLPTAQAALVDSSNRVPWAVNKGNWRTFEKGVELFIPGKTAGSTSKYGTYVEGRKDDDNPKILEYSAEFLLYEPDIRDYYVAVFALSKEGAISDGILSKIGIRRPRDKAQSFSIANAINITNLTTESIDNPNAKTTMHPIESMEPTFGWNTSFVSIWNEVADPDTSRMDKPFYELNVAQSAIDYRITIRAPSELKEVEDNGNTILVPSNIPSNTIYVEITGFTPAALSPDFAFKSTYNNPNIVTGLRDEAVTGDTSDGLGVGDVSIWSSADPFTQVTDDAALDAVQNGTDTRDYFIRNNPSGYIVTNTDAEFPLREYDIVIEAHDQYGKTSSRNEVWSNTIGNDEMESNWAGSATKYDIMGVTIEPPSGLIFASTGTYDNNPFTSKWLQTYQAYEENYPYVAQAAMYPNGFLDIILQHSEGTGTNAGKTFSTDQDLEKYFNNVAGLVYYFTTGDNTLSFDDLGNAQTPTRATPFLVDFKIQEKVGDELNYKIDSVNNKNAGFLGTNNNNFFGGIIPATEKWTVDDDYQIRRGYYLLNDNDTVDDLRIPLPAVSDVSVENIQIVIGFFDELSLLRNFESDGTTPHLEGTTNVAQGTRQTPKIFTDRDINLSTIPLNFDTKLDFDTNKSLAAAGTSLYLGESSIMGAGDTALAFRAWAELGIITAGMSPVRGGGAGYSKLAWTNDSTNEDAGMPNNEWVPLTLEGDGLIVGSEFAIRDEGTALPKALIKENCVFKNIAFDQGLTARYKMEQKGSNPGNNQTAHAASFWIQIMLDATKIPFSPDKYAVLAEIDGRLGINTTTNVVKPTGLSDGDNKVVINYYMEKAHGELGGKRTQGRLMMDPNTTDRYKMNTWVPHIIKVRFGLLATNQ